jgi:hypothetical protein
MTLRDPRFNVLAGINEATTEQFMAYGRAPLSALSSQPALSRLASANPDRLRIMLDSALEEPPNIGAIGVVAGLAIAAVRAGNAPQDAEAVHMFSRLLQRIPAAEVT